MSRSVPDCRAATTAIMLALSVVAQSAIAQTGGAAAPVADTGGIDGDLAGGPPARTGLRYAPGVLEAYQRELEAYHRRLASAQAEQRARQDLFRRQQDVYRRELASTQAARRKYEAERADYEGAIAGRR